MSASPPRVLVVDDDPTLRALLTRTLEREGLVVVSVGSGAEASAVLEDGPVRAMVVDQNLPDTTGTALAARFRDTLGPDCPPCLLVTGSVEAIAEETRALFTKVLSKPFSLPELAATVRQMTLAHDTTNHVAAGTSVDVE